MRRVPLYVAYLLANIPLVIAIFIFLPDHTFLWGGMGWGAVAAVIVGTVRNKPRHKLAWVLVAMALGCFISGDITYDVLTKYMHENNPFPSLADVFYLLTYPLFAAGLVSMVRARRAERDLGALIDALVVTASAALLSWIYLIQPYVRTNSMDVLQKVVAVEYPLGDILFMCVLARLLFAGHLRNGAIGLLTTGAVGLLVADCIYGWIQLHGNWKVGGPTDLGWVAFYVLWGAAALHPSMRELTERPPRRAPQLSMVSLATLSLATLIAPGLLVWRALFNHKVNDGAVIGGAAAFMFLLVMTRLTGLAGRQASLARREHTLRAIGERVAIGTDVHAVLVASVNAGRDLLGFPVVSCLATEVTGTTDTVLACTPDVGSSQVMLVNLEEPEASIDVVLPDGSSLPGCSSLVRWVCLPLSGRDGPERRILLAHPGRLPAGTMAVLELFVAQVALALGRVELAQVTRRRAEEARFRSLVQNASEVILVQDGSGALRAETPSVSAILGYTLEAVSALRLPDLLHPEDLSAALTLVRAVRSDTRRNAIPTEWRVLHSDGRWIDMEVVVNDLTDDAHVTGIVITLRDVSERKRLEGELRHRAFHDTLTDLANRELFSDRVENALSRRDRTGTDVSVLILDLDDFKLINDTFGHLAGDELLVAVGRRLKRCLREDDTGARLGGDEFAICAESGGSTVGDGAQVLAERILSSFTDPFRVAGSLVSITVSIGVAVAHAGTHGGVDMLREADLALYAAKNAGKDTYRFFEASLQEAASARLASRSALEAAIANEELRLHFQPIVRLSDGQIVGAEALVRWQHPERGLVPPLEFIPLAEETGLVVPLGRWVLDRACTQLGRWLSKFPDLRFKMSVNVSPRQLHAGNFVELVDMVLHRHDVSPTALTLEITESVLVQDDEDIRSCLQALHQRGIGIALDDFGTGYSALSYLQRFPLKTLKIDRSFVSDMQAANGHALIDAIIAMGRSLSLEVVAEGIELEDQARELNRLGCLYGQGYYFAKPMPAEAFEVLLQQAKLAGPKSGVPSLVASGLPSEVR